MEERITAIYQATAATQDAAVLEAGAMTARGLVALLTTLRHHIAELDRRLEQLVASHPDCTLFASLPGAGPVLVPRLIVAFGIRRERHENAFQMQCYSGIAPVKEASGKSEWIHFRWTCPKFLRQTFHEYASHSIPKSEWARACYQFQREHGKSHMLRYELWRTNGFVSFSGVGRTAHHTMSRFTCGAFKIATRLWAPALLGGGNRLGVSRNFLKIPLDGLTQKTPTQCFTAGEPGEIFLLFDWGVAAVRLWATESLGWYR